MSVAEGEVKTVQVFIRERVTRTALVEIPEEEVDRVSNSCVELTSEGWDLAMERIGGCWDEFVEESTSYDAECLHDEEMWITLEG